MGLEHRGGAKHADVRYRRMADEFCVVEQRLDAREGEAWPLAADHPGGRMLGLEMGIGEPDGGSRDGS